MVCSDRDKELWRAELTAKGELLIGSISRRADDQFELMDSIAVPTRVGDRDITMRSHQDENRIRGRIRFHADASGRHR